MEAKAAAGDPALVLPGSVFYLSTGGGMGHTGFVEEVRGGKLVTIEGNTNDSGSREGVGVFRRTGRKVNSVRKLPRQVDNSKPESPASSIARRRSGE